MCGIAGIADSNRPRPVAPGILADMAATLRHRGPDDEGMHCAPGIGLAHRRLAIIDLEGGRQPMSNEDGSVVVVFNGEIYNHAELRSRLAALGHRFRTRSDTETIVHGYEEWGEACVDRLRGMFAFAIWDAPRRRLLLARDRLGIKPLYFHARPGMLVFASEIKALLAHPAVPRALDAEALHLFLSLRYVPGPRTLFQGIHKLQPGHLLTFDAHGARIRSYWHLPPPGSVSCSDGEAERRFDELFSESVALRMMADVPLGVFLSGGLDSSAVLAEMTGQLGDRRIETWSVGYAPASRRETAADELGWARVAAEALGSDHHEVELEAGDFQDDLLDLVWHLDEPVADPACLPLAALSRHSRRSITVVLSGEGADEILGGYSIYPRMLAADRAHHRLGRAAAPLLRAAGRLLPGETIRRRFALVALPLEQRYRGVSRGFLPESKARLLGDPTPGAGDEILDEVFAGHLAGLGDATPLEKMLALDLAVWLPDDLLVKADRMTMANSQELRVPFLDHRLVELAFGLPDRLKVQAGRGKLLLRRAMAERLPRAILERPKKGFTVPTAPVLRRLDGFCRETLLARDAACRSWFDRREVERLVDAHRRHGNRAQEIWSLLVFELWHGLFLDGRLQPTPARGPRLAEVAR